MRRKFFCVINRNDVKTNWNFRAFITKKKITETFTFLTKQLVIGNWISCNFQHMRKNKRWFVLYQKQFWCWSDGESKETSIFRNKTITFNRDEVNSIIVFLSLSEQFKSFLKSYLIESNHERQAVNHAILWVDCDHRLLK